MAIYHLNLRVQWWNPMEKANNQTSMDGFLSGSFPKVPKKRRENNEPNACPHVNRINRINVTQQQQHILKTYHFWI